MDIQDIFEIEVKRTVIDYGRQYLNCVQALPEQVPGDGKVEVARHGVDQLVALEQSSLSVFNMFGIEVKVWNRTCFRNVVVFVVVVHGDINLNCLNSADTFRMISFKMKRKLS